MGVLNDGYMLIPVMLVMKGAEKTSNAVSLVRFTMSPTNLWAMSHPKEIDKKILELTVRLTVSEDVTSYCQRGLLYFMSSRYDDAERDLKAAIEVDKNCFLAHYYMSTLYGATGNPQSIEMHTKAIELYMEKSVENDGWMSRVSDYIEESIFHFKQAWLPDVFGLRGLRDQHREETIAVKQALRASVTKAGLYSNRGLCYYRREMYFDALRDFEQAIAIADEEHPNISLYFHNLGLVHFVLNDYEKALECFTRVIEYSNSSTLANAYAMRYHTYVKLDDKQSAENDRNQALKLDPRAPVDLFHYRLLPDSVLFQICTFLEPLSLSRLSMANRAMKELCYNPFLWPLKFHNNLPHLSNNLDPRAKHIAKERAVFNIRDDWHKLEQHFDHAEFDYTYPKLKDLCIIWGFSGRAFMNELEQMLIKSENVEKLVLVLGQCQVEEIDWSACLSKKIKHLLLDYRDHCNIEVWLPLLKVVGPTLESLDLSMFSNLELSVDTIHTILKHCTKLHKLRIQKFKIESAQNHFPNLKIEEDMRVSASDLIQTW